MKFWNWLLRGSQDLVMPKAWLENKSQMAVYEAWTRLQADPRAAVITKDSARMAREDFWRRIEEKRATRGSNVVPIAGGRRG